MHRTVFTGIELLLTIQSFIAHMYFNYLSGKEEDGWRELFGMASWRLKGTELVRKLEADWEEWYER